MKKLLTVLLFLVLSAPSFAWNAYGVIGSGASVVGPAGENVASTAFRAAIGLGCMVSAYNRNAMNATDGVDLEVQYSDVSQYPAGCFSVSTFTAPVTGIYFIHVTGLSLAQTPAVGSRYLTVYKNGGLPIPTIMDSVLAETGTNMRLKASGFLSLTVGDKITVVYAESSGANRESALFSNVAGYTSLFISQVQ